MRGQQEQAYVTTRSMCDPSQRSITRIFYQTEPVHECKAHRPPDAHLQPEAHSRSANRGGTKEDRVFAAGRSAVAAASAAHSGSAGSQGAAKVRVQNIGLARQLKRKQKVMDRVSTSLLTLPHPSCLHLVHLLQPMPTGEGRRRTTSRRALGLFASQFRRLSKGCRHCPAHTALCADRIGVSGAGPYDCLPRWFFTTRTDSTTADGVRKS